MGEVFEQTREYIDPAKEGLDLWSLTVEKGLTPKTARYNRKFLVKKNDKFKPVRKNEFVYNPMNLTLGSVDYNHLGKDVAVSGYYVTMKAQEQYDDFYCLTWMKTENAINRYKVYATGSLNEKQRVQFPTLSEIPAMFPTLPEQQKIGALFATLDERITAQQKLVDALTDAKATSLRLLFPCAGSAVPKVRMAGFAGAWEEAKMSDVLTISKEKNKDNQYRREDVLSVSREAGVVNQIEYQGRSFAAANVSNYKVVHPGQMIYTKSPLKGAPYGIFQHSQTDGIVSPLYAVYNSTKKALATFISLQFKDDNHASHYLSRLVTKGAKNTINVSDSGALEGKIYYPSIAEQEVIVKYFSALDAKIAAAQKQLATLEDLKATLLRLLFV